VSTTIRSETHPGIGSYAEVNRDILRILGRPGSGYFLLLAGALTLLAIGVFAWMTQVALGIGMSGLRNPVGWGSYITTFVFWVGIAHSGTLISAVLYLFRARWRQSIYRTAEAMTVFAVMTAGLFPIIHLGRPWIFYYLLPYPNERMLWPNFRSPLLWDVFAVSTYLTVSATFFFIGMIPDLAAARDSATVPWRRKLYGLLSLGWRGTDNEWKHFTRAYLYLAALATPLVLSVHSVVSWDFAMSIVPGWHTTIFAPYFVAGAIFSGLAMVITLVVPLRQIFGWQEYFTPKHFDMMARLVQLRGAGTPHLLEPCVRRLLVGHLDHDLVQCVRAHAVVVPQGAPQHRRAVHDQHLHQHRHVVRALRDHRHEPGPGIHARAVGQLQAVMGRDVDPGRQLRVVLHVVPDLRAGAAGRLGGRAQGSAARPLAAVARPRRPATGRGSRLAA
jgi:formate-dependent nitrite reductase membrane component NrfD